MSNEAVSEATPAASGADGALGVLATWRQTPRQVKALLTGVMTIRLAGFLQIFLILFLRHRGFSSGQASIALGAFGVGIVVGNVTGGWLGDRLNARTITMVGMLGSAGLTISLVYLRLYPLLLLAVLLQSAVSRLYMPASQAMITELTPSSQLVMVTAMYMLCFNVGAVVAPLAGVALASVSYNLMFWVEGLGLLVFGLIAVLALSGQPQDRPDPQTEPAPAARGKARGGYLSVLADRRYLIFLGAFMLMAAVYYQYTAALPLAIVRSGLSVWWYGALITMNGIIAATCQMVATKFVQKWPLRLMQLCGFGLLAVAYAIFGIAMVPVVLIVGTLTWTVSELIGAPAIFAYPGTVAPAHLRGRYFGAFHGVHGLAIAVGPVVGILLLNHLGQRAWLWLAGVAILATVLGQVALRRPAATPGTGPEPEPAIELAEAEPVG